MKKSLIALAVLAAAGTASAQSSVTLFGIVDTTLQWSDSDAPGDVRFRVTSNGYNASRLGFRGVEDLGGGMSASFWLEAAIFPDNGSGNAAGVGTGPASNGLGVPNSGLVFDRRSTVSLSGNSWGELRLGRDYVPTFWNVAVFDPFGLSGVGNTLTFQPGVSGPLAVRASNSIGYFAPRNLGGFYGQVMYAENELPNNVGVTIDDGRYWGLRVGYAAGPFNVAAAYGRTEFNAGDRTSMNIGGQWDFGFGRLMGQYVRDENDAAGGVEGDGWLIGGLVPVGAGEIRLSYSTYDFDRRLAADGDVRKLAVGYVHHLSKRTAVYATYARMEADGNAAAAVGGSAAALRGDAQGVDLGIRHAF